MSIAQDARSALREVRKDFRFYGFAALIIGLGIGANTAVFSVMSPLPLPPEALIGPVSAAIRATDPTMPTGEFRTLDSVVDRAVSPRRFTLLLLGSFAGTALVLAALGIYGVLSYTVSQRIPEIGIRMALGESGMQVLGRVVKRTMTLALVGIAIGAAGSLLVTRLIGSMLYGVEPTDAVTFGAMALVLLSSAALAGFIPARRASRTDPMAALRTE